MTTLKRCCRNDKCIHPEGPILPATHEYFHSNKSTPDGLCRSCKKCNTAAAVKYQKEHPDAHNKATRLYRKTHFDPHQIERVKRWRKNNPQKVKEIDKKAGKKWRQNNRKKNLERGKRWKQANPDKDREKYRRYRQAHPDKIRQQGQRRLARKFSLPATFTSHDWRRALTYFYGCCAYCSNPPSLFDLNTVLHEEHFIPVTKSGGYTPDNILPACQTCNLSKHNTDPATWLVARFGPRKAKAILKRINAYFDWVKQQEAHD